MKILVADDDPINRRLLEAFLVKCKYDVVLASNGDEAWEILQQGDSPRLAILDWMMPGMDGTQICRELRKNNDRPYVYVLLLTAKLERTEVIVGLGAGADDYLPKPFDRDELEARLRTGRRILELQEQLLTANHALQFQLAHDALTGMLSRSAVMETLRVELIRSQRDQATVGIIMVDLDHFKHVNDTYGHLAGDFVLRETAKRMRSSVRAYDAVGRYGGEEFLIAMPGCDIHCAKSRAERLRLAIGEEPVETPEGKIPVTLSLGVTVGGGDNPAELEALLREADAALYDAKSRGRNQVAAAPQGHGLSTPPAGPSPPERIILERLARGF